MSNPSGDYAPLTGQSTRDKITATRAEVEAVTNVMKENVNKVIDRGDNLGDISQRAQDLEHGATEFTSRANQLKRKYWWQNMKMNLIIGLIVLVVLIIIIISSTTGSKSQPDADTNPDAS